MNPSPFNLTAGESDQSAASPNWSTKKSRERYQDLIDSDSSAIFSCDASGLITYFNKQAAGLCGSEPTLGDTHDGFCGSRMLYRANGKYMSIDQSPMAVVLAGKVEGIYDAEARIQRSDGTHIVVIVNIAPLIDDNGIIVGAVQSFRENPMRLRES